MKIKTLIFSAICCTTMLWSCSTEPEINSELGKINLDDFPGGRPRVSLWDFDYMLEVREDLLTNANAGNAANSKYYTAYKALYDNATALLTSKPISVLDRPTDIPLFGINPNCMIIVSKYIWEEPEGSGIWVYRDGYRNDENYDKYDAERQSDMVNAVKTLGQAYFFSGREEFARKCVDYLKTWFINPATATIPNYDYGQIIPSYPNYNIGSAAGVINSQNILGAFASASLIMGSEAYTPAVDAGMRNWAERLYTYMTTQTAPLAEDNATNNHSVAYDQTCMGLCLFTGKYAEAKAIVDAFPTRRIYPQIQATGQMPRETARDQNGLGYSIYNLQHFVEVCEMSRLLDEDLFLSDDGDGTISDAGEYLAYFLDKPYSEWQARGFSQSNWDSQRASAFWVIQRILSMDPENTYLRSQLAAGRINLGTSRVASKTVYNIIYRYYNDQ